MFLLVLALCCRSTCQFLGNSENSNHMLSGTSHIEIVFLTEFLNMSNWQNRLCQKVPLHHSPGFRHDVPVMRRSWKHLHIFFAINREFKLGCYKGTVALLSFADWAALRSCFLPSTEPALSTSCWDSASSRARKQVLKLHLVIDQTQNSIQ